MADDRWWEDYSVGESWVSPGRTVTEADVVHFAMLSGDWMPLHTDREVAKTMVYGERVAHGILGIAMCSGLFIRTECCQMLARNGIALLGLEWKFLGPLRINDTVHLKITVSATRETSKPDRGIITLTRDLVNQDEEVVQRGVTPLMIRRRPSDTA